MGRVRTIVPDSRRLELSDGDWMVVKRRLTAGERKSVTQSLMLRTAADGTRSHDYLSFTFDSVLVYVLEWSLSDSKGKTLPITRATLENLDEADFDELEKAVDAHEAEMKQEIAEAKKAHGETTAA